jgi:hypothetical protein
MLVMLNGHLGFLPVAFGAFFYCRHLRSVHCAIFTMSGFPIPPLIKTTFSKRLAGFLALNYTQGEPP